MTVPENLIEAERRLFERGVVRAAYRIAIQCAMEGQPIPDWAVQTVVSALQRDFEGRNGRGKGKAAPVIESRRSMIKATIRKEVDRLTQDHGKTAQEAFAIVAKELTRYVADGKLWTDEMVKAAYYRSRSEG